MSDDKRIVLPPLTDEQREYLERIAKASGARMSDDKLVERLWLATKHGDEDHQAWLREAYTAFFAGQPVPEPRGRGNKEARIAELEAALQSERASMEGEIERVNEIIADKLCPIFGPGPYETLAREIVAALTSSKTGDE